MDDRRKAALCLLAILAVGAAFRFWSLGTLPHWDFDEGVNLDIADNLANGRMQWAALRYSFIPHPPLFFIVAAAAVNVFGSELVVVRGLCAFLGVLSTLLLYLIGRDMFDERTGLAASLLYAVYPSAVYFSRVGYANNLLCFLALLGLWFFVKYLQEKRKHWLYLLSAAAGLSAVTELLGACVIAAFIVLFWRHDRKNTWLVAAVSSSFVAAFFSYMLLVMPDAFIGDLVFSFGRFSLIAALCIIAAVLLAPQRRRLRWLRDAIVRIYAPVFSEIERSALLYYVLASGLILLFPPSDGLFYRGFDGLEFYLLGSVGFIFIRDKEKRSILLAFALAFLVALLGLNRSDHMLIPLYPFLSIAVAFLALRAFDSAYGWLKKLTKNGTHALALSLVLVSSPIALNVCYDAGMFFGGMWITAEDVQARAAIVDYINGNVKEDDFVIVDGHMTRQVRCRSAVFIQAAAYDGAAIEYMRPDYGEGRFLFNCSYRNARFIVLPKDAYSELMANTAEKQWLHGFFADLEDWQYEDIGGMRIYTNPA